MSTRKALIEDIVAHFIATIITIGFFAVIAATISGTVDLKDATTANIVGLVLGYVAGSLNTVLARYFTGLQSESRRSNSGKPLPPPPPPAKD